MVNRAERKAVVLSLSLRTVPLRWRWRMLLGGTLHLLIQRTGEGLEKLNVTGLKCTLK